MTSTEAASPQGAPGECGAEETLACIRDGVAVALVLNCCLCHQCADEAHYDTEFRLYWYT